MTRADFIANVTDWWGLIDFCREEDCDLLEDVYDEDGRDDQINEEFREYANYNCWQNVLDVLSRLPNGTGYFRENSWDDWDELGDDDFQRYKQQVLNWMDDGEYWQEEPREEDDDMFEDDRPYAPYDEDEDEDEGPEDEEFDVTTLMGMCRATLRTAQLQVEEQKREQDNAFTQLVGVFASANRRI